jgi:hypothetical protein
MIPVKREEGGFEDADSGDEDGDESVNIGEECEVAGEEEVEIVAKEVMLPR